ncbi:MAG: MAPEG family protein [Pseudomonadota bacterium]
MALHFSAIITLLSLLLFLLTGVAVAYARDKYGIKAPATTGNDDFERVFRVQMNTQENLILFLPALWLFNNYVSIVWAGIIGLVWLLGRTYYAISYIRSASARGPGFIISILAFAVLAIGASIGILMRIMAGL